MEIYTAGAISLWCMFCDQNGAADQEPLVFLDRVPLTRISRREQYPQKFPKACGVVMLNGLVVGVGPH